MDNWIIEKIINMMERTTSLGSSMIQTPETFNKVIFDGMIEIQSTIIMPIAMVILSLFLMLELYNVTVRTDSMGEKGFEIPFKIMFKFIICKVALESTPIILTAIFSVTQEITIGINSLFSGSAGIDIDSMRVVIEKIVNGTGFWDKMLVMMNVLILNVISWVCGIFMTAILYGRMIEMYVYIGISPLPMATFPNSEQSSIAKNFLKSFVAVALQGVLICITIAIMTILFNQLVIIDPAEIELVNLDSLLWECVGYSLIVLFAVLSCGKWSKSICNAM